MDGPHAGRPRALTDDSRDRARLGRSNRRPRRLAQDARFKNDPNTPEFSQSRWNLEFPRPEGAPG